MNEYFGSLHDLLERKRREPLVDRLSSVAPDRIQITMANVAVGFSVACAVGSSFLPWSLLWSVPKFFVFGCGGIVLLVGVLNAYGRMISVVLEWLAQRIVSEAE